MSNERKCEGCGCPNSRYGYQVINLMNGHLYLCKQCLAELNGKNPRVKELEAENAELRRVAGELYRLLEEFRNWQQTRPGLHRHPRDISEDATAALAVAAPLLAKEETP